MREIAVGADAVEVQQFYSHPAERVWRALTTPSVMADWLMEPTGFEPRVGTSFTMSTEPIPATGLSGEIVCEVLAVVHDEQLAVSWADSRQDTPLPWVVTWTLRREGVGTRMILRHSGFDPDDDAQQLARTIMGKGWVRIAAALDG